LGAASETAKRATTTKAAMTKDLMMPLMFLEAGSNISELD